MALLLSLAACSAAPRIVFDPSPPPAAPPIGAPTVLLLRPALLEVERTGWFEIEARDGATLESVIQERLREALVARGLEVADEQGLSQESVQGWEAAKAGFRQDQVYFRTSKLEGALSPPMTRWIPAEASVFCALTHEPDALESRTRLALFLFERGRLVWTRSAFFRSSPFRVFFSGFVGSGVSAEEALDQALLELARGLPGRAGSSPNKARERSDESGAQGNGPDR